MLWMWATACRLRVFNLFKMIFVSNSHRDSACFVVTVKRFKLGKHIHLECSSGLLEKLTCGKISGW
jgi:hypothetical protein